MYLSYIDVVHYMTGDVLLSAILDGVQASGNRDVSVCPTNCGHRLGPFSVEEDRRSATILDTLQSHVVCVDHGIQYDVMSHVHTYTC